MMPTVHTAPSRPACAATAVVSLVTLLLLLALVWPPSPAQGAVGRGLCVSELDNAGSDVVARTTAIAEVADTLHTGWVRLVVNWSTLEPERGAYSGTYLAGLDVTVNELHAKGVKLVFTFVYTPRWASDSSFWNDPPTGFPPGYNVRYPVRAGALDDMGATAAFLAARYAGLVQAYECWNEPNLWCYLYPQRTAADASFGARTYLKYLKAFSAGVERGDPAALVVAGSTAPIGNDDKYRTSPQRFARFLRDAGAAAHFDVYSHHPYTPGGSVNRAPDRPPNDPTSTVTLYNLRQLLSLFPGKPFYLTEYGYNTSPSRDFGGMAVTRVEQATYLRKAYAYAARYPQVKNLFWFLVKDAHTAGNPATQGVYTGLRETDGTRKLSWYAFARGNRLTIAAPAYARRYSSVRVCGTLSSAALGGLPAKTLVLQARTAGGAWRSIKTARTGAGGAYRFWVSAGSSRAYRVVWRGVTTSAQRFVRAY